MPSIRGVIIAEQDVVATADDDGLTGLDALMAQGPGYDGPSALDRQRRRRRGRIAGIVVASILVLALAGAGGYTWWALSATLPSPAVEMREPAVPAQPAAAISLPTSGASAISVAGGDAYLGAGANGIWTTGGTSEPLPIASITKLVTALVVLEEHPLAGVDDPGPTLTFDEADEDLYDKYYLLGATIASMDVGDSMPLRDALAAMLIPSASNYAEAVSTWAFGSQGGFVNATRRWLDTHGLTGTTIVEPTGISARNTSTTADLIAIAKLAAANPVVATLAGEPSRSAPRIGRMSNPNDLLGTDGITGLKTGNLGDGTYNLLYTATVDTGGGERLDVTGVALGGATRESVNGSVIDTLASIRAGFHTVPLATAEQELGSITTPWGSSATIVVSDSVGIFTWSDTLIAMIVETSDPVEYADGEVIGTIT